MLNLRWLDSTNDNDSGIPRCTDACSNPEGMSRTYVVVIDKNRTDIIRRRKRLRGKHITPRGFIADR